MIAHYHILVRPPNLRGHYQVHVILDFGNLPERVLDIYPYHDALEAIRRAIASTNKRPEDAPYYYDVQAGMEDAYRMDASA